MRLSLDYACPLFQHALPKYLQLDLERVQKMALSCIFPRVPYCEALKLAKIEPIRDHHNHLTKKTVPVSCERSLKYITLFATDTL